MFIIENVITETFNATDVSEAISSFVRFIFVNDVFMRMKKKKN